MQYQIDFLPVGDGGRSGDAIALRFGDFSDVTKQFVVVIDGGFKESGQALVDHIKKHYGSGVVDVVVSTHPDADHSSGLEVVLEQLKVLELWMHKPWEHTEDIAKMFKDGRVTDDSVAEGIRKSLDNVRCLETMAAKKSIPIVEPFQGVHHSSKCLFVLGPTEDYYCSLLPNFRCTPAPRAQGLYEAFVLGAKSVVTKLAEAMHIETLGEPEGTHAENNSSVILLLAVDGRYVLLTADAGVAGLEIALDRLESANVDFSKIEVVQIPHHGSRRNVGPTILNRLLGPIQTSDSRKRVAVVSASRDGAPKHPSKQVLNAFRRRGAHVWGTMSVNGSLMLNHNAPRDGWSSVSHLPFYEEVDD